jgi:hypothetical protein
MVEVICIQISADTDAPEQPTEKAKGACPIAVEPAVNALAFSNLAIALSKRVTTR